MARSVRPSRSAATRIVEGIAQRDDAGGRVARHHLGHAQQGGARVIGRQELAAPGIGTALLEMQIGEDKRARRAATKAAPDLSSTSVSPFTVTHRSVHTHRIRNQRVFVLAQNILVHFARATISREISSSAGTASGDTRSSRRVTIRPFTRASISASRAMSSSPVPASA